MADEQLEKREDKSKLGVTITDPNGEKHRYTLNEVVDMGFTMEELLSGKARPAQKNSKTKYSPTRLSGDFDASVSIDEKTGKITVNAPSIAIQNKNFKDTLSEQLNQLSKNYRENKNYKYSVTDKDGNTKEKSIQDIINELNAPIKNSDGSYNTSSLKYFALAAAGLETKKAAHKNISGVDLTDEDILRIETDAIGPDVKDNSLVLISNLPQAAWLRNISSYDKNTGMAKYRDIMDNAYNKEKVSSEDMIKLWAALEDYFEKGDFSDKEEYIRNTATARFLDATQPNMSWIRDVTENVRGLLDGINGFATNLGTAGWASLEKLTSEIFGFTDEYYEQYGTDFGDIYISRGGNQFANDMPQEKVDAKIGRVKFDEDGVPQYVEEKIEGSYENPNTVGQLMRAIFKENQAVIKKDIEYLHASQAGWDAVGYAIADMAAFISAGNVLSDAFIFGAGALTGKVATIAGKTVATINDLTSTARALYASGTALKFGSTAAEAAQIISGMKTIYDIAAVTGKAATFLNFINRAVSSAKITELIIGVVGESVAEAIVGDPDRLVEVLSNEKIDDGTRDYLIETYIGNALGWGVGLGVGKYLTKVGETTRGRAISANLSRHIFKIENSVGEAFDQAILTIRRVKGDTLADKIQSLYDKGSKYAIKQANAMAANSMLRDMRKAISESDAIKVVGQSDEEIEKALSEIEGKILQLKKAEVSLTSMQRQGMDIVQGWLKDNGKGLRDVTNNFYEKASNLAKIEKESGDIFKSTKGVVTDMRTGDVLHLFSQTTTNYIKAKEKIDFIDAYIRKYRKSEAITSDIVRNIEKYREERRELQKMVNTFLANASPDLRKAADEFIDADRKWWNKFETLRADLGLMDPDELKWYRQSGLWGNNGEMYSKTTRKADLSEYVIKHRDGASNVKTFDSYEGYMAGATGDFADPMGEMQIALYDAGSKQAYRSFVKSYDNLTGSLTIKVSGENTALVEKLKKGLEKSYTNSSKEFLSGLSEAVATNGDMDKVIKNLNLKNKQYGNMRKLDSAIERKVQNADNKRKALAVDSSNAGRFIQYLDAEDTDELWNQFYDTPVRGLLADGEEKVPTKTKRMIYAKAKELGIDTGNTPKDKPFLQAKRVHAEEISEREKDLADFKAASSRKAQDSELRNKIAEKYGVKYDKSMPSAVEDKISLEIQELKDLDKEATASKLIMESDSQGKIKVKSAKSVPDSSYDSFLKKNIDGKKYKATKGENNAVTRLQSNSNDVNEYLYSPKEYSKMHGKSKADDMQREVEEIDDAFTSVTKEPVTLYSSSEGVNYNWDKNGVSKIGTYTETSHNPDIAFSRASKSNLGLEEPVVYKMEVPRGQRVFVASASGKDGKIILPRDIEWELTGEKQDIIKNGKRVGTMLTIRPTSAEGLIGDSDLARVYDKVNRVLSNASEDPGLIRSRDVDNVFENQVKRSILSQNEDVINDPKVQKYLEEQRQMAFNDKLETFLAERTYEYKLLSDEYDVTVDELNNAGQDVIENYIGRMTKKGTPQREAIDELCRFYGLEGDENAIRYFALSAFMDNEKKYNTELYNQIRKQIESEHSTFSIKRTKKIAHTLADGITKGIEEEFNDAYLIVKEMNPNAVHEQSEKVFDEVHKIADEIESAKKNQYGGTKDIIAMRNMSGQVEYYQADPLLARLTNFHYSQDKMNGFTQAIYNANYLWTKLFRLGTTAINLKSMINQSFRDPINMFIGGGAYRTTQKCMDDIVDVAGDDVVQWIKTYEPEVLAKLQREASETGQDIRRLAVKREFKLGEAIAPGATETSMYKSLSTAKSARYNGAADIYDDTLADKAVRKIDWVNNKLGKGNEWRETTLRNISYQNGLAQGLKRGYSLDQARTFATFVMNEATTNFTRMTNHLVSLKDTVPYFGSAINGTKSFYKLLSMDPVGVVGRLVGGLIIPSMALTTYSLMDEKSKKIYKNIPEYQKEDAIVFVVGGQVISIPIPQELGAFLAPFRQTIEGMNGVTTNTFAQFAWNDILGFSPLELSGFADLDFARLEQSSPGFTDRIGNGIAKLWSQLAPAPLKSGLEIVTGIDPYTGKKIDKSYLDYDENGNPIIREYQSGETAKLLNNMFRSWGLTSSAPVVQNILANIFGQGSMDIADFLVSLGTQVPNGGWAFDASEEALSRGEKYNPLYIINERVVSPLTVESYDEAQSAWKSEITKLYNQKDEILRSDAWNEYLNAKSSETDPDKLANINASKKDLVEDYFNTIKNVVMNLQSNYGEEFTAVKYATVLSLMNMQEQTLDAGSYGKYLNKEEYKTGRAQAIQTMIELGFPSATDTDVLGKYTTDKDGNIYVETFSPLAILQLDDAKGAALNTQSNKQHLSVIRNLVNDSGLFEHRTNYQKKVSAAMKQKNWTEAEKLVNEYNEKVIRAVGAYIQQYTPESVLKGDTLAFLKEYIMVPSSFQINKYGKYATGLGNDAYLSDAFKEPYLKYIFNYGDNKL